MDKTSLSVDGVGKSHLKSIRRSTKAADNQLFMNSNGVTNPSIALICRSTKSTCQALHDSSVNPKKATQSVNCERRRTTLYIVPLNFEIINPFYFQYKMMKFLRHPLQLNLQSCRLILMQNPIPSFTFLFFDLQKE